MRLRERAAKWLVGAAAFLYDLFGSFRIFSSRSVSDAFHSPLAIWKSPVLSYQTWYPDGVTNLSPFAVVSLGFVMSASTAPVTHQDQDLQENESSSSATHVPHSGTQKIFGSRPCPIGLFLRDSWLLASPSWLTAWAVKTLMTLGDCGKSGGSGLFSWHRFPFPHDLSCFRAQNCGVGPTLFAGGKGDRHFLKMQ